MTNKKIIIFGNSGAGKTTLAKSLANQHLLSHLDLDSLAWQDTTPPSRQPIDKSAQQIKQFIANNTDWVIEGCYADLLTIASKQANKMIFINPGIDTCIENCKNRSWEPHKYPSKKAQDKNLTMLINWIKDYPKRTDEFSFNAHQHLYKQFNGNKYIITSNNQFSKNK